MSESSASAEAGRLLECTDCLEPAEAFALIGNDTRLAILEALFEADERPVAFSELYRAVGIRDSAQFNYHLQKLTGHFVRHVDDEGYEFRHAGEKVVRSIVAGTFTERPRLEPFEVEGRCVDCAKRLKAHYADEHLEVTCTSCGRSHGRYGFPPGGLTDRTTDEIARAFDQRVRHLHCLAADGVCPECSGQMHPEIIETSTPTGESSVNVERTCVQCGHGLTSAVGLQLLDDADVVSFHRDREIRLDRRPYWTLPWCVCPRYTEVLDRDPYRLEVRISAGGDELRVRLDDELQVTDMVTEPDS